MRFSSPAYSFIFSLSLTHTATLPLWYILYAHSLSLSLFQSQTLSTLWCKTDAVISQGQVGDDCGAHKGFLPTSSLLSLPKPYEIDACWKTSPITTFEFVVSYSDSVLSVYLACLSWFLKLNEEQEAN